MDEAATRANIAQPLETSAAEQLSRFQNQQEMLTNQISQLTEQQRVQAGWLQELSENIRRLTLAANPPAVQAAPVLNPLASAPKEPKLQLPLRYDGRAGQCRGFLAQCMVFFKAQASRFQAQESRVAFILSLLTGTALDWATPLIRGGSPILNSADILMERMQAVFDHDISPDESGRQLIKLRQEKESVAEFAIRFRALAGETGWPERALIALFSEALLDHIQDALAPLVPPKNLDELIATAISIDGRIRDRDRVRKRRQGKTTPTSAQWVPAEPVSYDEPMQVDGTNRPPPDDATPQRVVCRYCRRKGHHIRECLKLKAKEESR